MQLSEVDYGAGTPIEAYGPAGFRIGGRLHAGPVLVMPGGPFAWSGVEDTQAILAHQGAIDVVLVGTGREIAPVPEPFRVTLETAGIGVDLMGSGSACRTYNVLLGEGRRIGVALLPIG
ncbi:MAG: Mth938-like domain-containing protein [Pseudomonadota bacterium]